MSCAKVSSAVMLVTVLGDAPACDKCASPNLGDEHAYTESKLFCKRDRKNGENWRCHYKRFTALVQFAPKYELKMSLIELG